MLSPLKVFSFAEKLNQGRTGESKAFDFLQSKKIKSPYLMSGVIGKEPAPHSIRAARTRCPYSLKSDVRLHPLATGLRPFL
jgi:hypothetical protein